MQSFSCNLTAYMSDYINQLNQINTFPLLGIEEQGVALVGGINNGSCESDQKQVESRGKRLVRSLCTYP